MDGEQQLVMRAARGDAEAFRTLWVSHREAIYRFACWMAGDPAAAEDIAQECFLSLLERPERFQPARGSLLTFLLAIARNHCRLRWRELAPETPLDEEECDFAAPEVLNTLAAAEANALVTAAIAELPPLQREALYLFEYEELTLAEAAEIAQTDIGTFKSRLHRGRQRLKRALAQKKGIPNGTRP